MSNKLYRDNHAGTSNLTAAELKIWQDAWDACCQDVLATLGDYATSLAGCDGDPGEKYDAVAASLAEYFGVEE